MSNISLVAEGLAALHRLVSQHADPDSYIAVSASWTGHHHTAPCTHTLSLSTATPEPEEAVDAEA